MSRNLRLDTWLTVAMITARLLLTGAPAHAATELTLGIHPYLAASELHTRFSPLADHLGHQLNRKVVIRISPDYDAHVASVANGECDIAFMGPAPYVKLTEKSGPVPLLAAFESQGNRTFRGAIAVRQESPIKELSQLKGKIVAFGPKPSTMSNIVPRAMLLKAGVQVSALGKAKYLTNHENIALGVLVGQFDAGAMKEDIFQHFAPQGLRALAFSDPVPDHLFVGRRDLPPEIVATLRASLVKLGESEAGRRILASIQASLTALVPVKDSDYDGLRALILSLDS